MSIQEIARTNPNVQLIVSVADLKEFAATVARDAVRQFAATVKIQAETTKELMTAEETCEYLGVSRKTLSNWNNAAYLVPTKIGGRVYYKLDDIKNVKQ